MDCLLPNCFTLERKHKVAKIYGNEMSNTSVQWDASVMREVATFHLVYADGVGLLHPHKVSRRVLQTLNAAYS